MVKGENSKAEKVLKRVALYNCRKPLAVSSFCIVRAVLHIYYDLCVLQGRIVTLEEKERLQTIYSRANGVSDQGTCIGHIV